MSEESTILDAGPGAGDAPPVILTVAPNGARKVKADHPAVPLDAGEIGECARDCRNAGAAMIHLHVRNPDGSHSLDAGLYREAIGEIRNRVGDDILIQVTSEAVGIYTADEQMAMVHELEPEAVSLAIREICPDDAMEADCRNFLSWVEEAGVMPQYILYSDEDVRRFDALRKKGIVPGSRPFVLYVLGRYNAGQKSDPSDLLPFLAAQAEAAPVNWAMCAFGAKEAGCALTAAALGGHVRLGFENNTLLADGSVAPDNAALLRQFGESVLMVGRRLATSEEARHTLSNGK